MEHVIKPVVPAKYLDNNTIFHLNPSGRYYPQHQSHPSWLQLLLFLRVQMANGVPTAAHYFHSDSIFMCTPGNLPAARHWTPVLHVERRVLPYEGRVFSGCMGHLTWTGFSWCKLLCCTGHRLLTSGSFQSVWGWCSEDSSVDGSFSMTHLPQLCRPSAPCAGRARIA